MSARDIAFRIARHRYPRHTVVTDDLYVYLIHPLWGKRGCVDLLKASEMADVVFRCEGPNLTVIKTRSGNETGEDVAIVA